VEQVTGNVVIVRIIAESACSACHSKGMCTVVETQDKLVEVNQPAGAHFKAGDRVKVALTRSQGNLAVLYGYLLPFLILIITLLLASLFFEEMWAGIAALLILLPYYLVLYAFRGRFKKSFHFMIESAAPGAGGFHPA
jgi:sigma-E factor negative regulatory protein RseC